MRLLSLYSYLVLLACSAAIGFSATYLAPKSLHWLKDPDTPPTVFTREGPLLWLAKLGGSGQMIACVLIVLALSGLVVSLVPRIWTRFGKNHVPLVGVILSFLTLGLLCSHAFAIWWASMDGVYVKDREKTAYRRVLEEFALLEAAEGRVAATNQRIRELMGNEPRPITDPSQMSRSDAQARLIPLVKMLQQYKDPAMLRQLLASTKLFEEALSRDAERTRIVLDIAAETTGRKFENMRELHDWIGTQDNADWVPLTLYRFQPVSQAAP